MCQLPRISFLRSLDRRRLRQLGFWSLLPSPWLCALNLRSLFRGGWGRSCQTKRKGRVSVGLFLSKDRTKGEMACQEFNKEGLQGSKRNGILDRSTLHGIRVSVEGLWKQHGSHLNVSWMYFWLDVSRASLLPLKQVINPEQKVQGTPQATEILRKSRDTSTCSITLGNDLLSSCLSFPICEYRHNYSYLLSLEQGLNKITHVNTGMG